MDGIEGIHDKRMHFEYEAAQISIIIESLS